MPKKYHKRSNRKPRYAVHPSLQSFTGTRQNDSGTGSNERSVNELLHNLRLSHIPDPDAEITQRPSPSAVASKSVPPSIRDILNIPQAPAPRPRSHAVAVGTRRVRRPAGPAAPTSWLSPTTPPANDQGSDTLADSGNIQRKSPPRLDQLPGIDFPAPHTLQHAVLKAMARNWDFHLVYDNVWLADLPTRVKQLLLSYIAVYTDHAGIRVGMRGLRPLFLESVDDSGSIDVYDDVTRLDLSCALGRWITLKQLRQELKQRVDESAGPAAQKDAQQAADPPTSWEDEAEAVEQRPLATPSSTSITMYTRFKNLRYLSLARPNPGAADWNSLLKLVAHLPTLTHLSLAHWPYPSITSSAVDAPSVLRSLSRTTYCLKWLDLEGCDSWIINLLPLATEVVNGRGPDEPLSSSGPEWNGSWRGVEWLGLGPGWFPKLEPEDDDASITASMDSQNAGEYSEEERAMRRSSERTMYRKMIQTATMVRDCIRRIRRDAKGKWPDVSLGPESEELRDSVCQNL
ncbi:hypothetical protein AJ80_06854 [Polytolypa hystricis UAMH7299]|uniref:Tafazzin n=1 Tax=Polytolypa hystricis (strain UAMH7299) TaxID=1447883 RepID=A0A2B7XTN5_POLH7|nr:hypothetical protein AJ80_06854 [Polytolypa hystricis UAMH7299]